MKKITTLVAIIATTSTSLFAQTGNSYLMMNIGVGDNLNYGFRNGGFTNSKIGIQWIKGGKNNSAIRFGLQASESYFVTNNNNGYTSGDTFYNTYKNVQVRMPKFTFGKEFRKQIHKDISIYAGSDFGIGFGKSRVDKYEVVSYKDTNGYYTSSGSGSYGFGQKNIAMSISARPFIGIRTDWNRFVVGYEASLPINYTHVFGENINRIDGFKLQHTISVGYKFGKKK